MKKLCVFANDPLIKYFEKGEIKERYFNPKNFFDRVDFISFIDKDIEEEKIKKVVGTAEMKIHSVGKISITERKKHVKRISDMVNEIQPNIIRAFNPRLEGWFAAKCAAELKIPLFLSLHTQFDTHRKIAMKKNFRKFLKLKFSERVLESDVIKQADKIVIVFKIIEPYVIKHGGKKPIHLNNGIDYERFHFADSIPSLPQPLILSVGNLIPEKNHKMIIRAIQDLDVHCLIIGKGPQKEELEQTIKKLEIGNKIMIKESVPHDEIHRYYKSATVFVLAFNPEIEGIPMPVMEAMAAGKPVIIPKPKEGYSEISANSVIYAKNESDSIKKEIVKILNDERHRKKIEENASLEAKRFDKEHIEKQEMMIYSSLMKNDSNNDQNS